MASVEINRSFTAFPYDSKASFITIFCEHNSLYRKCTVHFIRCKMFVDLVIGSCMKRNE